MSDKRLIEPIGPHLWSKRQSEKTWHFCKYCRHRVPTFKFTEGKLGSEQPLQVLRCCWECGSGLEIITP